MCVCFHPQQSITSSPEDTIISLPHKICGRWPILPGTIFLRSNFHKSRTQSVKSDFSTRNLYTVCGRWFVRIVIRYSYPIEFMARVLISIEYGYNIILKIEPMTIISKLLLLYVYKSGLYCILKHLLLYELILEHRTLWSLILDEQAVVGSENFTLNSRAHTFNNDVNISIGNNIVKSWIDFLNAFCQYLTRTRSILLSIQRILTILLKLCGLLMNMNHLQRMYPIHQLQYKDQPW